MDTRTGNNNQIIRTLILCILLLAICLVPYETLFDEKNTICIHHALLGFQCPLCGMTRGVYQLMHLEFAAAVNYNFAVVLLPFYMGMDLATIFFQHKGLRLVKKIILILIAAALVLLYALRICHYLYVF